MTDKQIIVDGVDVNKCKHIQVAYSKNEKEYFVLCKAFYFENEDDFCDCREEPDCYYKQLKRKEQEYKELKENETMLISNLQVLWGKQIAEEQGDCKNIDYSKPRTKEIYNKITEIERTLKDVAFAQSVNIRKTKPLGDTGSPKSYKRWEARERKLLEREFLK